MSAPADKAQTAGSNHLLGNLEAHCLQEVLGRLGARDLANLACVQKALQEAVQQLGPWQALCRQEWALESPVGPGQVAVDSYRHAYYAWVRELHQYGDLAKRAKRCWTALERWAAQHQPAVAASLRPGASEAELDAAEAALDVRLPPALRCLYRIHDGQELAIDRQLDLTAAAAPHPSMFHGLFGGYAFYDHVTSLRLLPLARAVRWTSTFRRELQVQLGLASQHEVLLAATVEFNKVLVVHTLGGAPQADRAGRLLTPGMVSAKLVDRVHSIAACPADPSQGSADGVLRWMEEHARRLVAGEISVAPLLEPTPRMPRTINLFPARPPAMAEAVTAGVRVRASVLLVPELSGMPPHPYYFAYRICFALLGEEEQRRAGRAQALASVQLRARHWVIRDARGRVADEVRGEAVVGHHPLLAAGGDEFVYQSCTNQQQEQGSMEGDFTFVEGSISRPTGPDFTVQCPRFSLTLPGYIY